MKKIVKNIALALMVVGAQMNAMSAENLINQVKADLKAAQAKLDRVLTIIQAPPSSEAPGFVPGTMAPTPPPRTEPPAPSNFPRNVSTNMPEVSATPGSTENIPY